LNYFSKIKRLISFKFKKKIFLKRFKNSLNINFFFEKYKSDKGNSKHGFSKFYEKHFQILRKKKLNILEIGAAKGSSAASFYQYFIKSSIYSLDNHIEDFNFSGKNLYPVLLDINDNEDINNFYTFLKNKKSYFFKTQRVFCYRGL
jgi:hypothetical protein